MIVLSHRGYWHTRDERNTRAAFVRSFDLGFGTETDVRDLGGELVISHDPPKGGEMPFAEFLNLTGACDLPQAINIKADGLAADVAAAMREAGHRDWFAFDMSVPDTLHYRSAGIPFFGRISEYESRSELLTGCGGIWLDAFRGDWFTQDDVSRLLAEFGRVCVVSPELHGRDHTALWGRLRPLAGQAGLMICTDLPEEARRFFGDAR